MDHIKAINILISNQHGLGPGFSCQTQLISLIDDISCAMDNHYQTDLILLDFTKALIQASSIYIIILYGSGFNHGSLNVPGESVHLWL